VKGRIRVHAAVWFALLASFALAFTASCGGAQSNGLVHVVNQMAVDASFEWESPGLLGTRFLGGSGLEPIAACNEYSRGFGPGAQELTISSGSSRQSATLRAPERGQTILWFVIRSNGRVEEITAATAPHSPYCDG
jgi:hypothetical protein